MNPTPPQDVVNSTTILDIFKMDQTETENDSQLIMMAPLEAPEVYHDDVDAHEEKPKENDELGKISSDQQQAEDDSQHIGGIELFSRFGEFDDQQKQEDDSQNKENGNQDSGIQISSRFGEFDGFVSSSGPNQPFLKSSGLGRSGYPESLFSFPANAVRSETGEMSPEASIPDVNIYQHKKTVAQGMMDLALFSANANQLRYVVESKDHPYFWPGIFFITVSLILQVLIGCGLLLNTRYNVKDKKEICIANKINNFTIVGIFLVTVINVFICAFGVASTPSSAAVFIGTRLGEIGEGSGDDADPE